MKLSEQGLEFIALVEGAHKDDDGLHRMYKDVAGLPTIGYGHLLTKDELSSGKLWFVSCAGGIQMAKWHHGLSEFDALDLLDNDADIAEQSVNDILQQEHMEIEQHEFDALVSFTFNVGHTAFQASTLTKRLRARDFEDVPNQMRRWVYAGGKKVKGLANRRDDEIKLWLGEWNG